MILRATKKVKPTIYQKDPLPFNQLDAKSFENFIYGVFKLGLLPKEFNNFGKPAGTGDGGFDVYVLNKKMEVICIQCKNYLTTELNSKTVSHELAKVALHSYVEGSNVIRHYIVTSGKTTNELDSSIRSTNKQVFIELAKNEVKKRNNYKNDKKKAERKNPNIDYEDIVCRYIKKLDSISVWDKSQLDSEISTIYSRTESLRSKYFNVEHVLLEYPRPDFNESLYRKSKLSDDELVPLRFKTIKKPHNYKGTKKYTNSIRDIDPNFKEEEVKLENLFDSNNRVIMLISNGGHGKTSTCIQLRNIYLNNRKLDKTISLPIYIDVDLISSTLDNYINNELNILTGNWQSLPGNFLLLIDGLNEVSIDKRNRIIEEINNCLCSYGNRLEVLLTNRKFNSSNSDFYIPFLNKTKFITTKELSYDFIENFLDIYMNLQEKNTFLDALFNYNSNINHQVIDSPFTLRLSISYFKKHNFFPKNLNDLLENYFIDCFKNNTNSLFEDLPFNSFYTAIKELAYQWRIVYKKRYIDESELHTIIISTLEIIKNRPTFGFSNFHERDFLFLLRKNEIIIGSNKFYFKHDIYVDFLSSFCFAKNWKSELQNNNQFTKELYLFSADKIKDQKQYIKHLLNLSMSLAVRCATYMTDDTKKVVENVIIQKLETYDLFICRTMFEAIRILKTPLLISILKKYSEMDKRHPAYNQEISFIATHNLCILGDEFTLMSIIDEVEKDILFPGEISGGVLSLWRSANINAKIKISKERLIAKKKYCRASIETICYNRCIEDKDLIISSIKSSTEETIILSGLYALSYLDKPSGLLLIDEYIKSSNSDFEIIKLLEVRFSLNEPIYANWLIERLSILDYSDVHNIQYTKKIVKLLSSITFSDKHINKIKEHLKSDINQSCKNNFYQIINKQKNLNFVELLISIFEKTEDDNEILYIIEYFNLINIDENKKIISKSKNLYKENISTNLYKNFMPGIISFLNKHYKYNSCATDLITLSKSVIKKYNELTHLYKSNLKNATKELSKDFHRMEWLIFNFLKSLSTCSFEQYDYMPMLTSIFSIYELPGFNKNEQETFLLEILSKLSLNEIISLYRNSNFMIFDKLFIFKILLKIIKPYDQLLPDIKELISDFYSIERPDNVLDIVFETWNIDILKHIIFELEKHNGKKVPLKEYDTFITLFNKTDEFIIKKIFSGDCFIDDVFPININKYSTSNLKDRIIYWNHCYREREYIF